MKHAEQAYTMTKATVGTGMPTSSATRIPTPHSPLGVGVEQKLTHTPPINLEPPYCAAVGDPNLAVSMYIRFDNIMKHPQRVPWLLKHGLESGAVEEMLAPVKHMHANELKLPSSRS